MNIYKIFLDKCVCDLWFGGEKVGKIYSRFGF